jgi:hypothetical protein
MKEKIFNPASTNETSPAEGMAAVNTFNSEENEDTQTSGNSIPKNFDREETREQHDDTGPVEKERKRNTEKGAKNNE